MLSRVGIGGEPGDQIIHLTVDIARTLTTEPFSALNSAPSEKPCKPATCIRHSPKQGSCPENLLFPLLFPPTHSKGLHSQTEGPACLQKGHWCHLHELLDGVRGSPLPVGHTGSGVSRSRTAPDAESPSRIRTRIQTCKADLRKEEDAKLRSLWPEDRLQVRGLPSQQP